MITAPDKPADVEETQQFGCKKYAVDQGLPVLQPTNLKAPEFVEELKALQGNFCIARMPLN